MFSGTFGADTLHKRYSYGALRKAVEGVETILFISVMSISYDFSSNLMIESSKLMQIAHGSPIKISLVQDESVSGWKLRLPYPEKK